MFGGRGSGDGRDTQQWDLKRALGGQSVCLLSTGPSALSPMGKAAVCGRPTPGTAMVPSGPSVHVGALSNTWVCASLLQNGESGDGTRKQEASDRNA